MKLNKMLTCIAVILMTSTAAMAQGAPFKIQSYTKRGNNILGKQIQQEFIKITALDNVTLKDIKLNRGNCRIFTINEYRQAYKFGEVKEFGTNCGQILEAELFTDRGSWTFTFNR